MSVDATSSVSAGENRLPGETAAGVKDPAYSWMEKRLPGYGEEPIRPGKSIRLGGFLYGYDAIPLPGEEWPWPDARDWMARNLDLVSMGVWPPEDTAVMRAINPAMCLLLVAVPLILTVGGGEGFATGGYEPGRMAAWRLMTKGGEESPNALWGEKELGRETHYMDIGNKDWTEFFRQQWNERCRQYGADGYCIDGVPWNGVYYLEPGVELRDYADAEQVNATIYRFLDAIRTPREFLVVDDVPQPERQAHLDGVWGEDWLAYDSSLPWGEDRTARWELAVDYVARYSAERKPYIAAGWYHHGNENELEYLLATYLMAKESNSVVFQPQPMGTGVGPPQWSYDIGGYHLGLFKSEVEEYRHLFEVELGKPLAGRERRAESHAEGGTVWQRRFQKGVVLVNASVEQAASVSLPVPLRRARGEVVNQVELPPRSGAILVAG